MMVADSDLLIDYLRGREPGHERIRLELSTGGLATTAVNAFELASGATTGREQVKVETLLAALSILPLHAGAADRAASIRRTLEASGNPIGMADYLIAGVCLDHGATLLTRNLDQFGRVPDLRLGGVYD